MAVIPIPFWELSFWFHLLSRSWLPCWLSICLANNSKSSSSHCTSCLLQLTPRPTSISSQFMSDVPWEVLLKRKFMTKVSPAFNPSAYQGAPKECRSGQHAPCALTAAMTRVSQLWTSSSEQLGTQRPMFSAVSPRDLSQAGTP